MGCCQQEFETFKDEWRRYAARLRTQDSTLLRDQLLQCVETSLRRALMNTIDADRMASISATNLLVEIEKTAVVKQSDLLNKFRSVMNR